MGGKAPPPIFSRCAIRKSHVPPQQSPFATIHAFAPNHRCCMSKVLDGVRVLDFGRYIAGPYCAALLGDMGAEVIRIERVEGGEDRYTSPVAEDGSGAAYLQMGRNKLGM